MTQQNELQNQLKGICQSAETDLKGIEIKPFSKSAFSVLKEKIDDYISNLVTESIKISRRHQADTVSAAHVQRATEYLISITSRRFFRHLGTVGGIFLGASLSNILSMVGSNLFTIAGVLSTAALGMVGTFLIALHMAKE